jgi:DNA-binding CsgD family transcriptional regulator
VAVIMVTRDSGFWRRVRRSEHGALDRLVSAVQAGQSQVLVLTGEAGIGKSALLDHVARRASECRLLRAAGIDSEMELPFSGIHQLCGPLLGGVDALPAPQQEALKAVFGLAAGAPPDTFLVALATLALMDDAAGGGPLICLVDDVQWLDRASATVIGFVARRLLAEPIGMVLALRTPHAEAGLGALPTLRVPRLERSDALTLLERRGVSVDERVRDRVIAEARGNPLALLEFSRQPSAHAWGAAPADGGAHVVDRIEQTYLRRIDALSAATRRFLLLAAAEPDGDALVLGRAAEHLGLPWDVGAPAVEHELIEIGARVRFCHPLVRSAVYRAAGHSDRLDVHRALAVATDAKNDPDRWALHLAQSVVGPDESVASELETAAGRFRERGARSAAAALLERATALTADPHRRGLRAVAAAQALFECGEPDSVHELLAIADLGPVDDVTQAQIVRLRAQTVAARSRSSESVPALLEAARLMTPLDPAQARDAYLEALGASVFAGRMAGPGQTRVAAEQARGAPQSDPPPRAMDLLLEGVSARFTEGYASSVVPLRRALSLLEQHVSGGDAGAVDWLWLACPVAPEPIAPELWDDESWHQISARAVHLARAAGILTALPVALAYRAFVHLHEGEFDAAQALIDEADDASTAAGRLPLRYTRLALTAWRGDALVAKQLIDSDMREAADRGEGRAVGLAHYASAVLHNGLGQYEQALASARQACEYEDLGFFGWYLEELVEAAVRTGDTAAATWAVTQLEERTLAAGTDWALGALASAKAQVATATDTAALFGEAIERLGRSRLRTRLARAELTYGEWLRRNGQRVEARRHLRRAHDAFMQFGADAFAQRAARELSASGDRPRARATTAAPTLTTQELRIAQLARDGLTNAEIGSRLFLSPHTVEWHLRKVFEKLGIGSRKKLAAVLGDDVQSLAGT